MTIEYRLRENNRKHPQLHGITNQSPSLFSGSKFAVLRFYQSVVIFNHPFSYLKYIGLQLIQIRVLFYFRRAEKLEFLPKNRLCVINFFSKLKGVGPCR